jgi:hypothetical protein
VKRAIAALAVLVAALTVGVARAHADNVVFGVNDDAGKYEDGKGPFFGTLTGIGMTQNVMTVRWDETAPTVIPDLGFLTHSIAAATAAGVTVELDVYPLHSQALGKDPNAASQFAAWVASLAQTFPQVKQFVVMNECNQPLFVNPQFDGSSPTSPNISAAVCGNALGLAYDALKAVDSSIFVWGVGLSPRGNDTPQASSNVSTSPIKFLGYLGQWYRSSGRTAPIMDGLDVHPYSIPQSLPFESGYAGQTNNYSVANLPRVYQAFYDAFKGTAQPTVGPGGLKVQINEVGIQTTSDGHPGYNGIEASGYGVDGVTGSESYQAAWYTKLIDYVRCDPNIASVNIFHLVDEADLGLWQSGLYYRGYVAKASADAVKSALAEGDACTGKLQTWKPATTLAKQPAAKKVAKKQTKAAKAKAAKLKAAKLKAAKLKAAKLKAAKLKAAKAKAKGAKVHKIKR